MSLDIAQLLARGATGLPTALSAPIPFIKWLTIWRSPILRWAVFASDLGHQPADYLQHHCFVVHMEKSVHRQDISVDDRDIHVRTMYSPVKACMMLDTEILETIAKIPDKQSRDQIHADFVTNPPGVDTVRILVLAGVCYNTSSGRLSRLFPCDFGKLIIQHNNPQARSLSTQMMLAFMDLFVPTVTEGNAHLCRQLVSDAMHDLE
ncbi:hypothetical protein C8F04DRAFT_1240541 [Mycena alexandri]|uniref:Uncharacterized protein n=1 Tax=Mycena alexandri TaxID=1745969 RepID=A0AAD6S8K5_9AGAR|nr:hypothetical protein C8F04DRAFT_1240839 [Mycena alexandri]KAJ7022898.1 hypothetical protein C8F04DRAFT_1240541 [Mycena alexandri]